MSTTDYVYMYMKYVVWKKNWIVKDLIRPWTCTDFQSYQCCAIIKAFEKGTGSKIFSLEAWTKM